MQPEIKPSLEDLWTKFLANPKSFIDLRRKKGMNSKSPDFKQKESGLGLWRNTAPPWVCERLDNGDLEADLNDDGASIPEKVSLLWPAEVPCTSSAFSRYKATI